VEFAEALERYGFRESEERRVSARRGRQFVASPNRYLTYTVQAYEDGTALFSWEFALGEYLAPRGIQVGSDETLNQFLYPREDQRGAQDAAWLAAAIEQTQLALASIRFDAPEE
jgi:hypothetical protein